MHDILEKIERPLTLLERHILSNSDVADRIGSAVVDVVQGAGQDSALPEVGPLLLSLRSALRHRLAATTMSGPEITILLTEVDKAVRWELEVHAFAALLADLDIRLQIEDHDAVAALVDLCLAGRDEQPVARHAEHAHRVLDLATRHQVVEALVAAINPSAPGQAQLAHPRHDIDVFLHALDALAEVAAGRSRSAEAATEALMDLARDAAVAPLALVRLPAHRFDGRQLGRLQHLRDEWARLEEAGVFQFEDIDVRPSRLIEAILWIVMDARRAAGGVLDW